MGVRGPRRQASEWPIAAPTLLRFALLAVLATGSWLGGAIVECAISVGLD